MKTPVSIKIFTLLILVYATLAASFIFLPGLSALPVSTQNLPVSKTVVALISFVSVLIIYGGLGLLGLKLSKIIGFPELWDKGISNKERFVIPAVTGCILGILFIIIDRLVGALTPFGSLPHPGFPASLIASLSAAIGEETIFRLFFISFWTWLISHVILKQRGKNIVFWIVAVWSALAFSAGHLPSVMVLKEITDISQIPPLVLAEIFLLNSVLSLPAAYYFKKYGILATMGIHFWVDIVWHVLYGLV